MGDFLYGLSLFPVVFFHWSLATNHWSLRRSFSAAQEHFLLAYRDVRVHNVRKEKTRVMRYMMFWMFLLFVFLALAGC
jgi:hypothetical protein